MYINNLSRNKSNTLRYINLSIFNKIIKSGLIVKLIKPLLETMQEDIYYRVVDYETINTANAELLSIFRQQ